MAGRRPKFAQVPDPADEEAWSAFIHWLRQYPFRVDGRGLHLNTLWGWRTAGPTDWVCRLPGRQLHLMTDERWQELERRKQEQEAASAGGTNLPS